MPRMLNDEGYIAGHGLNCPFCGSRDTAKYTPEEDNLEVYRKVRCCDCTASWVEVYKLDHLSPISIPKGA